jgi:hypothetical protein
VCNRNEKVSEVALMCDFATMCTVCDDSSSDAKKCVRSCSTVAVDVCSNTITTTLLLILLHNFLYAVFAGVLQGCAVL